MKYKIEKIKVNCFDEYSTICNLTEAVNQIIDAISDLTSRVENLEAEVSHIIETEPEPSWPRIGDTILRFNSQGHIKKEIWQDSAKQRRRRDFLGVYKTKLEAEQKLAEIVVSGL